MDPKQKEFTINPTPLYSDIIIAQRLLNASPPRFHWLICVQHPNSPTGTKLHAIETGTNYFEYERKDYEMVFSTGVAAAAVVGNLGTHSVDDLDALLNGIARNVIPPSDVGKEPKFTCRVWVREAMRMMNEAGFLKCADVDALEAEMWEYGTQAAKEIENDTFTKAVLHRAQASQAI